MARKPFDLYLVLAYVLVASAIVGWASSGSAQRVGRPAEDADQAPVGTSGGNAVQAPPQEPPREQKGADQRVTGKVLDRDGKAVVKAEVKVAGPKRDKVWTDARGEFSFSGPAGDYVITVKASGRQQDFSVKVEDNQLKPSSTLVIEPELGG